MLMRERSSSSMAAVGVLEKRDESVGRGSGSVELDSLWPSATAGSLALLSRREAARVKDPSLTSSLTGKARAEGVVIKAVHTAIQASSNQDEECMASERASDEEESPVDWDEEEEEVGLVPLPALVRVTVKTATLPSVEIPWLTEASSIEA